MATEAVKSRVVSIAQEGAATRSANTRRRVQELLAAPEFRYALEAALCQDEKTFDTAPEDFIRRLHEGEFATAALVSIYGAEFVGRLKAYQE
jgi:hypothetical protein